MEVSTNVKDANGKQPRVRDAARTRTVILEGAMAEFTAKGFAGARIDAVAERAGVNVRAIYQHFESKAALFDAVLGDSVRRRHEQLLAELVGLVDANERFAEVVPLFRRVLADSPGWARLMAWKELSEDLDVDVEDIYSAADRQALYRREMALFDAARDRGYLPPGLDSDLLLLALTALAAFPWFVRPLTLLVTGNPPESPAFLARWDAFLLALGNALVGGSGATSPAELAAVPSSVVVAPHLHRELRLLARALDRAGLAGPYGHCSLRVDGEQALVTPPHPLRVIGSRDGLVVPLAGPLPVGVLPEVGLDRAVYRARPDVGAVCVVETPACAPGHDVDVDDNDDDVVARLRTGNVALRPDGTAVVVAETPARALALAVFLAQGKAVDPDWGHRRAERMWEYLTAGDPESAEPA